MQTRAGAPLEPTCRLPACRPVPNYYSCLQTFISWDGPQSRLHTRWANRGCSSSSTQEWTWIYSWWKEPVRTRALRLPAASPGSRHLWRHSLKIIIIALPFPAASSCVMSVFVAPPAPPPKQARPARPGPATHHPPPAPIYLLHPAWQGEAERSVGISCGTLLRGAQWQRVLTPALQSERVHLPPAVRGTAGRLAAMARQSVRAVKDGLLKNKEGKTGLSLWAAVSLSLSHIHTHSYRNMLGQMMHPQNFDSSWLDWGAFCV